MTVPSSSMLILAPVFSTISRITLPPVPITSRILSVGIFSDLDAGRELAEFGAGSGQRLRHLTEDMQAAVACAWSSATFMISSVMPEILMSICSEVTPSAVPATLKSMSPR